MTALDPFSANRFFTAPSQPFRSLQYGDITFSVEESDPDHPVGATPEGVPLIPRHQAQSNLPTPALRLYPSGDLQSLAQQHFSIIGLYGTVESSWDWYVIDTGYFNMTLSRGYLSGHLSNASLQQNVVFPTPLSGGIELFAFAQTSEGRFIASLSDGVIFSDGQTPAVPPSYTPSFGTYPGGDESSSVVGLWTWEGVSVSEADALDTLQAVYDSLLNPGPATAASTVGPAYAAAVAQGILGPFHSPAFPDTMWGGWLNDQGELIAMTGAEVPHSVFGPTTTGVVNTGIVDAGLMPSETPARFGLFDAEEGGDLIIYCDVTFENAPAAGSPLSAAPGKLQFVVTAANGG